MQKELSIEKALTPNTYSVFEDVSKLESIKDLYLCGGTAQALLMHHRKSEDLDFELLDTRKNRPELDISHICQEVSTVFPEARLETFGEDHFEIHLRGDVKLSFFRPKNNVPQLNSSFQYNNIKTPPLQELLGMKLYVISQRLNFRDYYDIACLLQAGYNLHDGIKYACDFSRHTVHSKGILQRLMAPALFPKTDLFLKMEPQQNLSPNEIRDIIKDKMYKEVQESLARDKIIKGFSSHTDASTVSDTTNISHFTVLDIDVLNKAQRDELSITGRLNGFIQINGDRMLVVAHPKDSAKILAKPVVDDLTLCPETISVKSEEYTLDEKQRRELLYGNKVYCPIDEQYYALSPLTGKLFQVKDYEEEIKRRLLDVEKENLLSGTSNKLSDSIQRGKSPH